MRILYVTREEPFYLPGFFKRVLSGRRGDTTVVAILSEGALLETIRRHFVLLGPRAFILLGLEFVALKLLGRLRPSGGYSVAGVANSCDIPVCYPGDVNSAEFLTYLRQDLRPDVVVSVTAPQIFKQEILSLPPLGCINEHSALLPRYRGMLPSFWVLANGETETGVTVHYMNSRLDDGDIIAQERVPIFPHETQDSLIRRSKSVGAEVLLKVLDQLEKGSTERHPNPREQATYFSFPTKGDIQRFRQAGRRFR